MPKHGKRYLDNALKVDRTKEYTPRDAFEIIKSFEAAKFDETIEVHMRLGVDPRHADQQVRSTVSLPAGTGKTVRIMVFAEGEAARQAAEAGADFVGTDEYVQRIQDGWLDFDVAIAIPQVMGKIGRLGRVLGPRGLMPSPRAGTVVQPEDVAETINQFRQGRVEFRVDRTSNLHIPIGKQSFTIDQIEQNFAAVMDAVMRVRPTTIKGQYIRRMAITTTMGPGIRLNVAEAQAMRAA
ncbi:MAG: 50S ribosomal protein L1 [Anaerolineae bacterium]|nr:50S ribosomal protein L1 [Anaerolineae bacterium]